MLIPTEKIPRLPRLAGVYWRDPREVVEFYDGDFRDIGSFRRQARRVRSRSLPREEVAAVLREQNESYGCGRETADAIGKIAREGACAVVTGQQVGLFSGPLYTIYKALTAVKLADSLNRRRLGSFVPVFWLASDDHDLAEADRISLLDKDHRPEQIRCPIASPQGKTPVSDLTLPPDIADGLEHLESSTRDSEFKRDVLARLGECYKPGRPLAEAFARWMARLFEGRGLILIDAADPRLKELGSGVFCREIEGASPSTRAALASTLRLRRVGYDPQVRLREGVLNLYYYADGCRRSIRRSDGAFVIEGLPPPVPAEELLERARRKPHAFSPNVLLRPIYQDALLPTVAYVGGPGEIAYFAQMKGVYEAFDLPMPVIYPRISATIVEQSVGRVLTKFGLSVPDLWRDPAGLGGDASKKPVPGSLVGALRLLRDRIERDFESLEREAVDLDAALRPSVALARGKIVRQLAFLEKRAGQAAARRDETAVRQLRKAAACLFPNGQLQERALNIVPFLIKYGFDFMETLGRGLVIDEPGHQALFIR